MNHFDTEIYNPKLVERLRILMPDEVLNPPAPKTFRESLQFQFHPIRSGSDMFTNAIDGELPRNTEELRFLLWTFGEVMFREMERQVNATTKVALDVIACSVNPIQYTPKVSG